MEQVTLKSKDRELIVVESAVLKHSAVLSAKLEDMLLTKSCGDIIHVPDVEAEYLRLMIEWLARRKKSVDAAYSENTEIPNNQEQNAAGRYHKEAIDEWDHIFFQQHQKHAFRLMAVANRLKIENFLKIGGCFLNNWLRSNPDEVREVICYPCRREGPRKMNLLDNEPCIMDVDLPSSEISD